MQINRNKLERLITINHNQILFSYLGFNPAKHHSSKSAGLFPLQMTYTSKLIWKAPAKIIQTFSGAKQVIK